MEAINVSVSCESPELVVVDEAVEARVREHLVLVERLAWKYRWTGLPLDELVAEGNVGLMEAAGRFEERGIPFGAYASQWIRAQWAARLRASVEEAWPELDARERALVEERMLAEEAASAELLARRFGVTAVRIRQIEQGLRAKLKKRLTASLTTWDAEAMPRAA
ncbi:hypothetical protein FJV41_27435 [Myxococcus llanfairpwllgwyngyllgogerychwyrndrobwllllantysiliogogogochensis]|uniref:RNA polymerase sigma-70 region 2 domain-containing protein n=1 Tax=Myxococcus llanfairpwllgwyngyllgogerychwyrndrobwllllantysiliogogogochensis TaxID=2590453 RepID=A0A540WUR3_9BACT|nr:sigma factor [Myxococcus llanfairpwllgwyngyllgogerychwyrndrobwllllantysiliogogogochensis]TQF12758.1 hypothetical protein FJV41_27435 [Myxococcus llanfairpwllgwyngyllgogerychwyrndrobwllllantysiliogogogochensis]